MHLLWWLAVLEGRGRGGLGIPGTWVTAGCDVDGHQSPSVRGRRLECHSALKQKLNVEHYNKWSKSNFFTKYWEKFHITNTFFQLLFLREWVICFHFEKKKLLQKYRKTKEMVYFPHFYHFWWLSHLSWFFHSYHLLHLTLVSKIIHDNVINIAFKHTFLIVRN